MHANIIMFHVQIELQKAMLKAMFWKMPYLNVAIT
jgi:hypothetical protein